ncbi:16S rRNA (guanine(527)-N(7))-methyltransferase RsmG [Qipengyuania nanhaisediminis]|uniref:16S rRNA (guanine(527)-N(7))-methyltransferase RsmG n=1 Tax=Qipengyuania nanhaisediminis TaxID=604088 RepID=UPI0038B31CB6
MSTPAPITTEDEARAYVANWAAPSGMEVLSGYIAALLDENGRQNLISKPSEAQLWQRHIADSAQLLEHVSRETREKPPGPWLDLGTGPGLPGMVIAILQPQIDVVLVESRARRVEFLQTCVRSLGLANCRIEGQRLEITDPFDSWIISARAFAPLEKLLRLSAPFSTSSTKFLLPKGRSAAHELQSVKPSIRRLFHVKQSLTDPEAGIIVSQ